MSTNSFGGQDRDFLSHAVGEQVFLFECWTCPRCYYTGFPDDFVKERVNPELIGLILEQRMLKPAEKIARSLRDSEDIPAWIRYDLLSQVLKLRKDATALDQAWAYMRTAQTQRFNAEAVSRSGKEKSPLDALVEKFHARHRDKDPFQQTMMVARDLEGVAADVESEMAPEERPMALLYASRLY